MNKWQGEQGTQRDNITEDSKTDAESGVAAIEFVLGFTAFWTMCIFLIEIGYISYISSVGDLLISQAARQSKLYSEDTNYLDQYKKVIEGDDSIWQFLVNKDNFRYSIRYVKDYDELSTIIDACESEDESVSGVECGTAEDAPIAIYRISYSYDQIFGYFGNTTDIFSREMLVIQEYQRSEFEVSN